MNFCLRQHSCQCFQAGATYLPASVLRISLAETPNSHSTGWQGHLLLTPMSSFWGAGSTLEQTIKHSLIWWPRAKPDAYSSCKYFEETNRQMGTRGTDGQLANTKCQLRMYLDHGSTLRARGLGFLLVRNPKAACPNCRRLEPRLGPPVERLE